jgi:hypothetical protein
MTVAQRLSANRMIAAKGQTVTITRRVTGDYDPATSSAWVQESTQTGKGVILPLSASVRKLAGTNIAATDSQCLLSALDSLGAELVAPGLDDMLTDAAGKIYTVVEVAPLAPAGLAIVYDMTVRGNP